MNGNFLVDTTGEKSEAKIVNGAVLHVAAVEPK